jgi:hypothetical protein
MPTSARTQDQNGYLLVEGCPVSSFGIFQYSAAQVGLDGDPNRIVNVFRPESVVSDPEFISSLQIVPLINDHEMLSGFKGDKSATAPEEYGVDGVMFGVGYAKPWARGDLKIFSRSMQSDLSGGKKDLSLGYTCDFLMESGTFDGQQYEVVQTNMRGNHIALVDVGRVPGARVLDGKKLCFDSLDFSVQFNTTGGEIMPRTRRALDSGTVEQLKAQLKALLPTFEQFLSEEATEPSHQGGEGGAAGAEAGGEATQAGAEAGQAAAAGGETGGAEVSAGQATEPTEGGGEGEEDDTGATTGAAGGEEGAAGAAEGGGAMSLEDAVAQLEGLLSKMRAAMGQGGEGGDEGGAMNGEGTEEGQDTVTGLEGTAREGADGEGTNLGEGGQGRASEGPAAGANTGADAALRGFYADLAVKTRLYERVSKVVGAFDSAAMDARGVAAYGIAKLGLKGIPKGTEVNALDGYLAGLEAGRKQSTVNVNQQRAADAAASDVPAIDAYFKE